MKKYILLLLAIFIASLTNIYSQNITNTLGTSGVFTIKDNTNTFLSLNQSDGTVSLISPLAGNQRGSIFKGTGRFLHTYYGTGTQGYNTFLGINSGNFTMGGTSIQGSYNTAVGHNTLTSNTTGYNNSAFGYQSLFNNTTGSFNSAFGNGSLLNNTIGSSNSALGVWSLYSNTTGLSNSAFGRLSLYSNTTGNYNTALGYLAGYNITTGSNNITIGYDAQVPLATTDNQIRLGNTAITYAGIQVAWTVTSDRRWKNNIKPIPLGLDFISRINPVSYSRNNDESNKTEFGIIAQELEAVLDDFKIKNLGLLTIDDNGYYSLRYNDLIAPMIKAIQELKAAKDEEIAKLRKENDDLKSNSELQIAELKSENKLIKEKLNSLEKIQERLFETLANLKLQSSQNDETILSKR